MFRRCLFLTVLALSSAFCPDAIGDSIVVSGDARLTIDLPTEMPAIIVRDRGRLIIEDTVLTDGLYIGNGESQTLSLGKDINRRVGTESPRFYPRFPYYNVVNPPGYNHVQTFDLSDGSTVLSADLGEYLTVSEGFTGGSIHFVGSSVTHSAGTLTISGAYSGTSDLLLYDEGSSVSLTNGTFSGTISGPAFRAPETSGPRAVISAPTAAREVFVTHGASLIVNDLLITRLAGLLGGDVHVRGTMIAQYLLASGEARVNISGRVFGESVNFTNDSTATVSGRIDAERITLYDGAALVVNHAVRSYKPLVLAGGVLSGIGKVIGDVKNIAGTISPGKGIGKLLIEGDVNSGNVVIEVASGSNYDRLRVDGHASMDGALTLDAVDGYKPKPGDRFKIVTATRDLDGRFGGEAWINGFPVKIIRTGDSLYAEVMDKPRKPRYEDFTKTENQAAVARTVGSLVKKGKVDAAFRRLKFRPGYIVGGFDVVTSFDVVTIFGLPSELRPVSQAISTSEAKAARQAGKSIDALRRHIIDRITPTDTFSLSRTALTLGNTQISQLENNLISLGSSMALEAPVTAGAGKSVFTETTPDAKWSAFVEGSGIFARVPDLGSVQAFDYQTGAATVGAGYNVTPDVKLGLYSGYAGTSANLPAGSELSIDSARFGLFGSWSPVDRLYTYGSIGGAVHAYDYDRRIVFPGVARTATSDPVGMEINTLLGGGYDLNFGDFSVGPFGSMQFTHLEIDGFKERNAGALNLRYKKQEDDSLRSTAGMKASYSFALGSSIVVEPLVRIAWQHEYLNDPKSLAAALKAGSAPYFTINSPGAAEDTLLLSAGASISFGERCAASVYYTNSSAFDDGYAHAGQAMLRCSW